MCTARGLCTASYVKKPGIWISYTSSASLLILSAAVRSPSSSLLSLSDIELKHKEIFGLNSDKTWCIYLFEWPGYGARTKEQCSKHFPHLNKVYLEMKHKEIYLPGDDLLPLTEGRLGQLPEHVLHLTVRCALLVRIHIARDQRWPSALQPREHLRTDIWRSGIWYMGEGSGDLFPYMGNSKYKNYISGMDVVTIC